MAQVNFEASTLWVSVSADSVNRRNGSAATVDMSELTDGNSLKLPPSQASTQLPEITAAPQSFRKADFRSVAHVEFVVTIGNKSLHPLQRRSDFKVSGILFLRMDLPAIIGMELLRETRPWYARRGRGKLSHDALDDRHESRARSGTRRRGCFGRAVPALLVSALHFRSAPRPFAGRRSGFDAKFFSAPAEAPCTYPCRSAQR